VYLCSIFSGETMTSEIQMLLNAMSTLARSQSGAPSGASSVSAFLLWLLFPVGVAAAVLAVCGVRRLHQAVSGRRGSRPRSEIGVRLTTVIVDDDAVLLGYAPDDLKHRIRSALKLGSPDTFETILLHLGSGTNIVVPALYRWQHNRARLTLRTVDDGNIVELKGDDIADRQSEPAESSGRIPGIRCRAL
jgi:hypothetical protein